jgi:hypothetical protein
MRSASPQSESPLFESSYMSKAPSICSSSIISASLRVRLQWATVGVGAVRQHGRHRIPKAGREGLLPDGLLSCSF